MGAYLKIENPGICPPEGFTVLGVSLSRLSERSGVIGQFGSGNKHAVAVLLRNGLSPIIFTGTLKIDFQTRSQQVSDGLIAHDFQRVVVKYGGTDPATGANRSGLEDLGFVLDYGREDWQETDLALREFISNAIDRSIRENDTWTGVKVEVVNENQVRARRDYTRVFVPMNADVLNFFNNLGRWFLHFSEPEMLEQEILLKRDRNLGDRKAAVIYRRGVRVREFTASDQESLFDYNLCDLRLDEARKASDWDVRHYCGQVLARADVPILAAYFDCLVNTERKVWEMEFDEYSLKPSVYENKAAVERRAQAWALALTSAAGDTAVLTGAGTVDQLQRKGYRPVLVPDNLRQVAVLYGLKTSTSVLSGDELAGREITTATPDIQAAVDFVWQLLVKTGLSNDKSQPVVKCFQSIMSAGTVLQGYYRDGTIYINRDLAGARVMTAGIEDFADALLVTVLEELAHYVTNSTDNSRDFQDYLLNLTIKLVRRQRSS